MRHLPRCLAIACMVSMPFYAQANPQLETASAHLQFSALLNGEGELFEPPGMNDPFSAMGMMFQKTLPAQALAWEVAGFDPLKSKQPMECISTEDSFETESLGEMWRYHDERVLSCIWGGQPVMSKVRITFEEENGAIRWANTEMVEVIDSSEEVY